MADTAEATATPSEASEETTSPFTSIEDIFGVENEGAVDEGADKSDRRGPAGEAGKAAKGADSQDETEPEEEEYDLDGEKVKLPKAVAERLRSQERELARRSARREATEPEEDEEEFEEERPAKGREDSRGPIPDETFQQFDDIFNKHIDDPKAAGFTKTLVGVVDARASAIVEEAVTRLVGEKIEPILDLIEKNFGEDVLKKNVSRELERTFKGLGKNLDPEMVDEVMAEAVKIGRQHRRTPTRGDLFEALVIVQNRDHAEEGDEENPLPRKPSVKQKRPAMGASPRSSTTGKFQTSGRVPTAHQPRRDEFDDI
jgi:hypothetical protein